MLLWSGQLNLAIGIDFKVIYGRLIGFGEISALKKSKVPLNNRNNEDSNLIGMLFTREAEINGMTVSGAEIGHHDDD